MYVPKYMRDALKKITVFVIIIVNLFFFASSHSVLKNHVSCGKKQSVPLIYFHNFWLNVKFY